MSAMSFAHSGTDDRAPPRTVPGWIDIAMLACRPGLVQALPRSSHRLISAVSDCKMTCRLVVMRSSGSPATILVICVCTGSVHPPKSGRLCAGRTAAGVSVPMGMLLDPSLEVRQLHQERGQRLSSLLAAYPLEQERERNVGRTEVFTNHVLAAIGRLLRRPVVPPRIQRY
jgi:hypothetical protein